MSKFPQGLQDKFQVLGHWWVAGRETQKVFGILSFSEVEIELIAKGKLDDDPNAIYDTTIFGQSEEGFKIELQNCYSKSPNDLSWHLCSTESILVNFFLVYTSNGKDVRPQHFNSIKIEIPWILDSAGFDGLNRKLIKKADSYSLDFGDQAKPQLYCNAIDSHISFILEASAKPVSNSEVNVVQRGYVQIKAAQKQTLDWFLSKAHDLELLLTVLSSEYSTALSLNLTDEDDNDNYHWFFRQRENLLNLDSSSSQHLVKLHEIEAELGTIMENFFLKDKAFYPLLNILCASLSNPGRFHQLDLVNLAQAVEGYHRALNDQYYLAQDDFDNRIGDVLKMVERNFPDESHCDLRKRLNDSLSHGNTKSQRTRFKDLINGLPPKISEAITGQRSTFIEDILATRNYYIHLGQKDSKKKILNDELVTYRKMQLQLLLTCLFLQGFGVPMDKAEAGIKRTKLYKLFRSKVATKSRSKKKVPKAWENLPDV